MSFFDAIEKIVDEKGTSLCVGLDPWFEPERRAALGLDACFDAALEANLRIVEATAPFAACYKPNLAFYEAFGPRGYELLERTVEAMPEGMPWIADAKRGDIDSTAAAYAQAIFGNLGADAVTLSPYMGKDGADAFLAWKDTGLFLLCKTSNPGATAFQALDVGGEPLFVRVARECSSWSPRVGLVVAGNDPEALRAVRAAA
ncbi:MAG TPA: orotidine-5'-phosphate decarboxylase, partial [Rectinemataceae bacterium]